MTGQRPAASVVIVTRNRCEEALRAVRSAVEQTYAPLEVLVYDDASTDGTAQVVAELFPEVRVVRGAERADYIVMRNRGFRESTGEIVFSIDDDAYFTDPRTVEYVMARFAEYPRAAALALRYLEPGRPARLGFLQGVCDGDCVRNYIGCAHAIRRAAALAAGGYREWLIHQGEERDLCIRLLERGFEVRYVESPPIVHEPSVRRDHAGLAYMGLRNTLLFDVLNVPLTDMVWRLPIDVAQLVRYRVTWRTFALRMWNVLRGLAACVRYLPRRKSVSRATYRRFRSLTTHGPVFQVESANTRMVKVELRNGVGVTA